MLRYEPVDWAQFGKQPHITDNNIEQIVGLP